MNFKRLTRTDRQQDRKKKRRKDDEHDSEDIQTTYNELWWTSNIELGRTPKVDQTFSNKLSIKGGGIPLWRTKPAEQYLTGSLLWSLVDFGFRNRLQSLVKTTKWGVHPVLPKVGLIWFSCKYFNNKTDPEQFTLEYIFSFGFGFFFGINLANKASKALCTAITIFVHPLIVDS